MNFKECNAYNIPTVDETPDNLNVIIDDGPHTYESMEFFLRNYIKKLAPGGILVLEDITNISWTPNLVKLIPKTHRVTVHDMRWKQLDPQLMRLWQKGLDVIVVEAP